MPCRPPLRGTFSFRTGRTAVRAPSPTCLTSKGTGEDHPQGRLTGLTIAHWGVSRPEEAPVELPEDIRREIDKSPDRDTILEVVSRLQSDGVKITSDVLAAILATIAMTEGTVE